jgi:hypothetical protein
MKSLFFLLVTSVLLATIAPRVEAKTRLVAYQFDVISDGLMTFESLQQKAESIAQDSANQSFSDPQISEVKINISGEQQGQIVPVLFLSVTRENWTRQPSVTVWAKQPGGAKTLLGFDRSIPKPYLQPNIIATSSTPIRDSLTEREPNFYP